MGKAVIEKKQTTIDNQTGDVRKDVKGTVKGFADGFRRYVEQGAKAVSPDIAISVGQFPEGHPAHPAWAVQILATPFDTQDDADLSAARIEASIRRAFVQ